MILAFPGIEENFFRCTLFLQNLSNGLANGAVYALMALTVVIIYKTTGHLNFAQGEMAMFSTFLVFVLAVEHGWHVWLAILAVVGLSLLARRRARTQRSSGRWRSAACSARSSSPWACSSSSTGSPPRSGAPNPAARSRSRSPARLNDKIDILPTARPKFFITYKALGVWVTVAVLVRPASTSCSRRPSSASATEPWPPTASRALLVGIPVERMLMLGWASRPGIGTIAGAIIAAVPRTSSTSTSWAPCCSTASPPPRSAGSTRIAGRGGRRAARRDHRDVRARVLHLRRQRAAAWSWCWR